MYPFWYPLFLPGDLCSDKIMVSWDMTLLPGILILESGSVWWCWGRRTLQRRNLGAEDQVFRSYHQKGYRQFSGNLDYWLIPRGLNFYERVTLLPKFLHFWLPAPHSGILPSPSPAPAMVSRYRQGASPTSETRQSHDARIPVCQPAEWVNIYSLFLFTKNPIWWLLLS